MEISVLVSYYAIGYKKVTYRKLLVFLTILESKCIDINLKDATRAAFFFFINIEKLIVVTHCNAGK